jgi:hypothetical protein
MTDPDCATIPIVNGSDPNDKSGPPGVRDQHYVANGAPFSYNVFFENMATASAPAQQVVVTDQLDVATLDLNTFGFGPISFGSYTVQPPPGLTQFVSALDLRPAQNVIAKIDARLDQATGLITWRFTSLDASTEQVTTDPLAGFLPPNVNPPAGEGKLLYTLTPKTGLATGTTICNQATVVFDANPLINTPRWCNTLDNTAPVSQVQPLPPTQSIATFTVQWTGSDLGSGISDFTIYVSHAGGPFTKWLNQTTALAATYTGVTGHTYGFYSIARDFVGNVENSKTAAEATITITGSACATDVTSQFKITAGGFRFNNSTQQFVQTVTLQQLTSTAIQLPLSLVLDNLSFNASLLNKTGNTTCGAPIGSPFINVLTGSTSVVLDFADPSKNGITYNARLLMGSGTK